MYARQKLMIPTNDQIKLIREIAPGVEFEFENCTQEEISLIYRPGAGHDDGSVLAAIENARLNETDPNKRKILESLFAGRSFISVRAVVEVAAKTPTQEPERPAATPPMLSKLPIPLWLRRLRIS